jgi:hypothetical protein
MRPGVRLYLRALSAVALETSRDLRLLPVFPRLVMMIPSTVAKLID